MELSAETIEFLEKLDRVSNGSLTYRGDLGAILELARIAGPSFRLGDLAFAAKACWKIAALLKKTGPGGRGADALAEEFRGANERLVSLVSRLYELAGEDERAAFKRSFFSEGPDPLRARLDLCRDISWIKNISIDTTIGPK